MKNYEFYRSLHGRGLNTTKLAERIGRGRAHVSQVLAGVPGRGGQTRRKLAAHLTREELVLLGWVTSVTATASEAGAKSGAQRSARPTSARQFPRRTLFQ